MQIEYLQPHWTGDDGHPLSRDEREFWNEVATYTPDGVEFGDGLPVTRIFWELFESAEEQLHRDHEPIAETMTRAPSRCGSWYAREGWEDGGLAAAQMRDLIHSPFSRPHAGRNNSRRYRGTMKRKTDTAVSVVSEAAKQPAAAKLEQPSPTTGNTIARPRATQRNERGLMATLQSTFLSDLERLKWTAGVGVNTPRFRQLILNLVDECRAPIPTIADAAGVSVEQVCDIAWSERGVSR